MFVCVQVSKFFNDDGSYEQMLESIRSQEATFDWTFVGSQLDAVRRKERGEEKNEESGGVKKRRRRKRFRGSLVTLWERMNIARRRDEK